MALFLAGVAAFLMIAVVLAHHLKHPADTLGLRAARREIVAQGNDWDWRKHMGKPKHEPWYKPRADEDADEELVNWLGGRSGGNGGGGNGRNDHGRKGKDSCMVMLLLMFGGGAAAVVGAYAAVKGIA